MNRQVVSEVGITEEDYRKWCNKNNKPYYKPQIKKEFFTKIQEGKLVKINGKIEEV